MATETRMFDRQAEFTIPGPAVGKQRPKFTTMGGFGRAYTPAKTVNYEVWVKDCFERAGIRSLGSDNYGIVIEIHVAIPKSASKKKRRLMDSGEISPGTKPDVDNVAKSICDALIGIAYKDDSLITGLSVSKEYSEQAFTVVTLFWKTAGGEDDKKE